MIQKGIQSHKHFKETFAVTKKIRVLVGLKFITGNWLTKQNKQQQQNFINKQIKLLPAASEAIRGGTMRAKYKKSRLRLLTKESLQFTNK